MSHPLRATEVTDRTWVALHPLHLRLGVLLLAFSATKLLIMDNGDHVLITTALKLLQLVCV